MSMQTILARRLTNSTYWKDINLSAPLSFFRQNFLLNTRRKGGKEKNITTIQCEDIRTLLEVPIILPQKYREVPRSNLSTDAAVLQTGDINKRLKLQSAFVPSKLFRRNFSVTVQADNQFGLGRGEKSSELHTDKSPFVRGDWGVRLSNENAYLSWCRNTYLSTVVGIAMMGEGTTILAQQAGEGAFFLAGMNLSWGTYQFLYNTVHLRKVMGMSLFGGLMNISFAVIHFTLWLMVCMLYIGYSDDADLRAIEEESRKQKRRQAKKE